MAGRVQNTFSKAYPSRQLITNEADTKNTEGLPAFTLSLEERYLQMLMTNTLGQTYYASTKELVDGSLRLHAEMLAYDPIFMAKAAVYARNSGFMRLQPILSLVYLTTNKSGLAPKIFNKIIKTPGDLVDFVTLLPQVRTGRGLGRGVKRMINKWLKGLSEYHAMKYGGAPESKLVCNDCGAMLTKVSGHVSQCPKCYSRDIRIKTFWSLARIIQCTRPKTTDRRLGNLFQYVVRGMSGSPNYGPTDISALPQIKSLETVKYLTEAYRQGSLTAGQYCQLLTTNIEKGRLPYEVVTSLAAPTKEVWEYLMREMPLFALLRHLNTLQRHGVLESRKNIQYVVDRLTDAPAVKKAMLWPSRIATAYNNFDGPQQIRDALRDMADLALSSIPTINGTTAVFLDISGSMVPEYKQHGAVLGVGALKASTDAEFWCFGSQLWYPNVSTRDSILSNLDKVVGMRGGGTHTIGCIEHLLGTCKVQSTTGYHTGGYNNSVPSGMQSRQPVKVDNIIILTDEQQNSGAPVVTAFREYRKRVNKDARMFIVDVAPYSGSIASSNEPGVHFIFGWSDEILRYISFVVNGTHGQTDTVARMSLD